MLETLLAGLNTAQDVQKLCEAAKERVLALIDAHFAAHPAPVSQLEDDGSGDEHYLNLLQSQVDTRKFEGVSVIELHADAFLYQPDYSENGWESYGILSLDELLDVLDVLEKSREPVAVVA